MANVSKSYVICTPGSGSGNTELTLKAKVANLGNRVNQTDNFTITAPGVTHNKTFSAILQAAAEFVSSTTVLRLGAERRRKGSSGRYVERRRHHVR